MSSLFGTIFRLIVWGLALGVAGCDKSEPRPVSSASVKSISGGDSIVVARLEISGVPIAAVIGGASEEVGWDLSESTSRTGVCLVRGARIKLDLQKENVIILSDGMDPVMMNISQSDMRGRVDWEKEIWVRAQSKKESR